MAKKKEKIVSVCSFPTLKRIRPKTIRQNEVFKSFQQGWNLCLHGVAGTGKTFISLYMALEALLAQDSKFEKVIIIRSVVPTREIGYLPGNLKEKIEIYETPYRDIAAELFDHKQDYDYLKSIKKLEFQTTSHLRGQTFHNAIILVDEIQNLSYHELSTTITRIGENCRLLYCGDTSQSDLREYERGGVKHFLNIVHRMHSFASFEFSIEDIQRGPLVREFLEEEIAYYKEQNDRSKTVRTQETVGIGLSV